MLLLIFVVFLAVFAVIALLMMALNGGSKVSKQTRRTLASVLKRPGSATDEDIIDVRKSDILSSIPWIHDLLARIKAATELRRILDQADLTWTPARLLLTSATISCFSGYLIHRRTELLGLSLLGAILTGFAPFIYVWNRRQRRLRQFQEKLPEALDLMVSALRAGHSMSGALGAAAREAPEPIGREFRLCFEEQNFGIDLRTAMDNLIERIPLQDVRMISAAMLIHKESGGNLAEVLDKTAQVIRDRFRIQQQIRVHTAQGRLSGWILSLLPVALSILLYGANPKYMTVLFTDPRGHKMMAVAATMDLIGLMIIRKIVNVRV
jgi:tight adherence protein B